MSHSLRCYLYDVRTVPLHLAEDVADILRNSYPLDVGGSLLYALLPDYRQGDLGSHSMGQTVLRMI